MDRILSVLGPAPDKPDLKVWHNFVFLSTTLLWIKSHPLKKNWKSGSYSFQIMRIKKSKRSPPPKIAALRAGSFSENVWRYFWRNVCFVLLRFCLAKSKKVSKIFKFVRHASRGDSQKAPGFWFFSYSHFRKVLFCQNIFQKSTAGFWRRGLFTRGW